MLTNKLKSKTLKIRAEIASPLKAIQLSDFHFKEAGRLEMEVKSYLESNSYDLLLLTGDYLSSPDKLDDFFQYLGSIDFQAPVIAVPGNHDYKLDIALIAERFKARGIIFLENGNYNFKKAGQSFNLIGVGSPDLGRDKLEEAVNGLEMNGGYNIILSHTYDIIDKIAEYQIDLILAGDTHGGQIYLPFITKFLMKRVLGLRYLAGRYKIGDTTLYINRGLGTSGLPVRFNCRPELTEIRIIPDLS